MWSPDGRQGPSTYPEGESDIRTQEVLVRSWPAPSLGFIDALGEGEARVKWEGCVLDLCF